MYCSLKPGTSASNHMLKTQPRPMYAACGAHLLVCFQLKLSHCHNGEKKFLAYVKRTLIKAYFYLCQNDITNCSNLRPREDKTRNDTFIIYNYILNGAIYSCHNCFKIFTLTNNCPWAKLKL